MKKGIIKLIYVYLILLSLTNAFAEKTAEARKTPIAGGKYNCVEAHFTITNTQYIYWEANCGAIQGEGDGFFLHTPSGRLDEITLKEHLIKGEDFGTIKLSPGTYYISIHYQNMGRGRYIIHYNRTASIKVTPSKHDFGDFFKGDSKSSMKKFTIYSNGDIPVEVSHITCEGDCANFDLDYRSLPRKNPTLKVRYIPGEPKRDIATIKIEAIDSEYNTKVSPITIVVKGETKKLIPDISCSGTTCSSAKNLGTIDGDIGESEVFIKNLKNTGNGNLKITNISIINDSSQNVFSLDGTPSSIVLKPDESHSVSIKFTPPPGESTYCGHLEISTNDPDTPVKQCFFSAKSHHPVAKILIENQVLDYKEVELGFSYTKAIIIRNIGDALLTGNINTLNCDANSLCKIDKQNWTNEEGAFSIKPGDPAVIYKQIFMPKDVEGHTMNMQIESNDLTADNLTITLIGKGIKPIPLDNVLVLDRSGSMKQKIGDNGQTKIKALQRASNLYFDLLRPEIAESSTGDKYGLVKYNNKNSIYVPLDYKEVSDTQGTHNNKVIDALSDASITNARKLLPMGNTGIGGAMKRGVSMFSNNTDRKQVMIVMTDGKENCFPKIKESLLDISNTNPNIMIYSVGLGNDKDLELSKLQSITNIGNGFHQVMGDLSNERIFSLEEFYFKIYSNANGMNMVVDPTIPINIGASTESIIVQRAKIVSSDKSAVFLVLDNPLFRDLYNLELVSPSGKTIELDSTIGGITVHVAKRLTYKIYKVVFPDISKASTYTGEWVLKLTPKEDFYNNVAHILKYQSYLEDNYRNKEKQQNYTHKGGMSIYQGIVPIGFGVAVKSDYKMTVNTATTKYTPGSVLTITAKLTDKGWASLKGDVYINVTRPDGNTDFNIRLFDNGTHGDFKANDGIYSTLYTNTTQSGSYKILYRSMGQNDQGEIVPREDSRYVSLVSTDNQDDFTNHFTSNVSRLRLLSVSIKSGHTVPYKSFDINNNWGFLVEAGVEYSVMNNLSLELLGGIYNFDPDNQILGLNIFAKKYNNYGEWRPFVSVGTGIYRLQNTNTSGYAVGFGLNRNLDTKLQGEVGIYYHNLSNNENPIQFSTFKAGLIFIIN